MRPGLMRPGLMRPGLMRQGLMRPGLMRPGLMRPGLMRQGFMQQCLMRQGLIRQGRPRCARIVGDAVAVTVYRRACREVQVGAVRPTWVHHATACLDTMQRVVWAPYKHNARCRRQRLYGHIFENHAALRTERGCRVEGACPGWQAWNTGARLKVPVLGGRHGTLKLG
eukprot:351543-Chlamydomonas_euryale.AAC.2